SGLFDPFRMLPPQLFETTAGLPIASPAGSGSVNATPVRGMVFEFVIVNVRLVCAFSSTLAAPNAFEIFGGDATVSVAWVLATPVPPFVDVGAFAVTGYTPDAVPVTVTLNVQGVPTLSVGIEYCMKFGEFVCRFVEPHTVVALVGTVRFAGRVRVPITFV